ncbi:MAG: selenocysteine-specific translation elongation factor [Candidatus Eisenbacteria bacterium]|nr:selenocysteine-specific translation elongation factor [Candidatus Eisenbacteria bacterium]
MTPTCIGTAGHVDHGKTALVKRLTGIDTDRLKEEKERGISIELGFAPLHLKSGTEAAIIDVPGHEKFVHHMLSGVGGIDLVLLVIAADEGIMPQTIEHLRIVELLGIRTSVIALTKCDLVERDWLEMVRKDVEKLISSSPLKCLGIVPVSSVTGQGVNDLLSLLDEGLRDVKERDTSRPLRLPIDRVFTMEGFGAVVTGTLWRGKAKTGETVEVLPSGKKARIRSVEVQKHKLDEARAGQRVALALHGIRKEEIERGEWVVEPGSLFPSMMLDAKLDVLGELRRPIKTRERIRFHLGARESLGRVIVLGKDEARPAESCFVQLRLEESVVAERGDRFVIRAYSPVTTIAGGSVIDPNPVKHKPHDSAVLELLEKEESGTLEARIELAFTRTPYLSMSGKKLAPKVGLPEEDVKTIIEKKAHDGDLVFLPSGEYISKKWVDEGERVFRTALSEYEREFPLRWGMGKSEMRAEFPRQMSDEVFSLLVEKLSEKRLLFIRGERLRFGSDEVELSPGQMKLKDELEKKILSSGFSVPELEELEKLSSGDEAKELIQLLVLEGSLVKVTSEMCFHKMQIEKAAKLVTDFIKAKGALTISDFKELTGVSRKYGVPLLEYLDKIGITVRDGDKRILRKGVE